MAFSSTIQAELALGTGKFQTGLASATASMERFKRTASDSGQARASARAMDELLTAQEKLAEFRRGAAFEQADAVGKIKLVESELQTLAQQRSQAEAGTARHMQLQLEIEQKRAQLQSLRTEAQSSRVGTGISDRATEAAKRDRAWQALQDRRAKGESMLPPVIPRELTIIEAANAKLKSLRQTLGQSGAGQLFSAFGIGALITGYTSALNRAQALRDENEKLGRPISAATRAVAEYADAIDRAKAGLSELATFSLSIPVRIGEAWGKGQAMFLGLLQGRSPKEVLRTIRIYEEAARNSEKLEAGREAAMQRGARRKEKADADALEAARNLNQAEQELANARIEAAKKSATEEGRVTIATLEVADAQQAVAAAKAGTVDRAQAELALLSRQQELAEAQRALEASITAEKDKQLAREAELAQRREAAAAALARAVEAQRAAALAYQRALSDQSGATFAEVAGGQRGSAYEQRLAAEVERLRAEARAARDAGQGVVVGGRSVSMADLLNTRANQIQSGIGTLNSAERDPLGALAAQLTQANQELAQIRQSLEIVATD